MPLARVDARWRIRQPACISHGTMEVFQLAPNHLWNPAPGHRMLIINRGGLRCEIPSHWTLQAPHHNVFAFDGVPPNHQALIAISCRPMPAEVLSLPLDFILDDWVIGEERTLLERGAFVRFHRWPLYGLWLQIRVLGSDTFPKLLRLCCARADQTQALILMESLHEDEAAIDPAWQTLIGTLVLGDYLADPQTGRRRMQRG